MSPPTRPRQRKASVLAAPSRSDDPEERKRILNVLAQRRYSISLRSIQTAVLATDPRSGKRKREHVKALESQLVGKTSVDAASQQNIITDVENDLTASTGLLEESSQSQSSCERAASGDWPAALGTTNNPPACTQASLYSSQTALFSDMSQMSLGAEAEDQPGTDSSNDQAPAELFTQPRVTAPELAMLDWAMSSALDNGPAYVPAPNQPLSPWTWDPLVFLPSISLPSTPGPDLSSRDNESTPQTDPSSSSSSSSPDSASASPPKNPHSSTTHADYTDTLQTYCTTHDTLADAHFLESHDLKLLHSFLSIASLFNLDLNTDIWSLTASSPFYSPPGSLPPPLPPNLPPNLHPTSIPLTTPHHPIIDILPWPVARNKLILVFSAPPHLRPPQAQPETALIDLVYDIEDSSEGVRMWGESPFKEESWEVGSKVWGKWWWAFDGAIVRKSNEWRRRRGVGKLGMGMGMGMGSTSGNVVGEVG
ncbi:hypothetical protein EPUS_09048 [Endocarpon pusillum Z07020]|uniref:Uncharacterized protein n=1 Tax=Endocarpon pusillum (strain Z07020 / HMAS-L-300199) TaxID=1263415 RepID=U1G173_ENDPU|nr:uncharacterized protein EPUS_09048 [Endocarpon pusillum Z07020]ERF70977.1 hypothetical protein EPUS_09048 [Endocarpon pusillum Z07020]